MKTRIVKETMGDGSVRYLPQYAEETIESQGGMGSISIQWLCADELRFDKHLTPHSAPYFTLDWARGTIDMILSSEVVCSEVIEYP